MVAFSIRIVASACNIQRKSWKFTRPSRQKATGATQHTHTVSKRKTLRWKWIAVSHVRECGSRVIFCCCHLQLIRIYYDYLLFIYFLSWIKLTNCAGNTNNNNLQPHSAMSKHNDSERRRNDCNFVQYILNYKLLVNIESPSPVLLPPLLDTSTPHAAALRLIQLEISMKKHDKHKTRWKQLLVSHYRSDIMSTRDFLLIQSSFIIIIILKECIMASSV